MLESSGVIFSYLSPTWTRVLVVVGVLVALGVPEWAGIALRCDPSSPGHSRCLTLCRDIGLGRNPSCSRSPSSTRSPAGTRSL